MMCVCMDLCVYSMYVCVYVCTCMCVCLHLCLHMCNIGFLVYYCIVYVCSLHNQDIVVKISSHISNL